MSADKTTTFDVATIFTALEKVFSGETPYDDAFMALDIHTAFVRKNYPNFYKALSSVNGKSAQSTTADELLEKITRLEGLLSRPAPTPPPQQPALPQTQPQPLSPVEQISAPEPAVDTNKYPTWDEWYKTIAPSASGKAEYVLRWPEQVPMQPIGTAMTVNVPTGGRKRFTIMATDPSLFLMRLRFVGDIARDS